MPTECSLALWSFIFHEWHICLPALRALSKMLLLLLVVLRLLYSATLVPVSFFVQFPKPVFGMVTFGSTNLPLLIFLDLLEGLHSSLYFSLFLYFLISNYLSLFFFSILYPLCLLLIFLSQFFHIWQFLITSFPGPFLL